ncbi:hypothetical protein GCM10027073_29820 [Streptomyces chlorus]
MPPRRPERAPVSCDPPGGIRLRGDSVAAVFPVLGSCHGPGLIMTHELGKRPGEDGLSRDPRPGPSRSVKPMSVSGAGR